MTLLLLLTLLLQALTAPDPAQMEQAPDLGYAAITRPMSLPDGWTLGAPSSVAVTAAGSLLVFNRGAHPLVELDRAGRLVRAFGEGLYTRPHGMRVDRGGNIWTADDRGHTVTKMSPEGRVLLVLGVRDRAGEWDEAAGSRLFNQPTDIAFGPTGDVFVTQGHGQGVPRVLRFDATGRFITSWGGLGKEPGQFDIAHSVVVDATGLVYVADRQNRRVQIFDADGRFLRAWTFAGLPCGLHIDDDGQMWMVSGFAGQILKLDANGRAIAATGRPGKGLGEFGEAHFMTLGPNREIYVADTVNATLHTFVRR
jgi:DNA-binding beta-propeller fold protein YncE